MPRLFLPPAILGLLAAATPLAHAQPATPSLMVNFTALLGPASVAPVPLGPLALLLSVLAIGAALLFGKRMGRGHWLSLPVVAALVGIGFSQPHTSQAEKAQRELDLQTSPARLDLNLDNNERLLVRNTSAQPLQLDSLAFEGNAAQLRMFDRQEEGAIPTCRNGLVLAAKQACVIEVIASPHFTLQTDDVIKVKLSELHPTQPSVGYDQIFYHLARKQPDLTRFAVGSTNYARQLERTELKRANDYCEDTGRGKAENHVAQTVSLVKGTGFNCSISDADVKGAGLKTVVVGPNGQLYLTDGHHTFTTLWELKDGGPDLPVFVRVAANFSDTHNLSSFWGQMKDKQYAWLFDAAGKAITPDQMPASLGLKDLADDPYRSLVYLTRDMGYKNANVPEFAEFYWGLWLRNQGLDLKDYDLKDLTPAGVVVNGKLEEADSGSIDSYVAAVRDAALLMRQTPAGTEIYDGVTNTQLGQNTAAIKQKNWDSLFQKEIWQDDILTSDDSYRNGGKAWYAVGWRLCGAPVNDNAGDNSCWKNKMSAAR